MTDSEKGLALIALLIWAMWRTEQTGVTIYQNCPDGSQVPLGQPCPPMFLDTSTGVQWRQCADGNYFPTNMACPDWTNWTGGDGGGLTIDEIHGLATMIEL